MPRCIRGLGSSAGKSRSEARARSKPRVWGSALPPRPLDSGGNRAEETDETGGSVKRVMSKKNSVGGHGEDMGWTLEERRDGDERPESAEAVADGGDDGWRIWVESLSVWVR